jgi:hypothetical protein
MNGAVIDLVILVNLILTIWICFHIYYNDKK